MVFEIYKISRMITKSYGTNCNQKYSLVQTLMPQMKTDLTYITSNQKIKISFSFPHSFHTFNKKWAKTFIYPKLFFLAETFFLIYTVLALFYWNKNKGMLSIKTPLNIYSWNHYLDSCCTLMLMIPEMMARAIYCKKINLNK